MLGGSPMFPQSVGFSLRTAVPGVWSVAGGAQIPGTDLGRINRWTTQFTLDAEGLASMDVAVSMRSGEGHRVVFGTGWDSGRVGIFLFMFSQGSWASGIRIPWLQPVFQPFRPLWWCKWSGGGIQSGKGTVRLDWHAGAMPSIRCSLSVKGWEFGWGSRGGWLSRHLGRGDIRWQCMLGIARGDMLWMGVDAGPVLPSASHDLHARLDALD